MRSLAELQTRIASVTMAGADTALADLTGGREPRKRLAIHARHYRASLTEALHDKFPACRWLVGGELFRSAAEAYVRATPPSDPCIAHYGAEFPEHLAALDGAAALPYVAAFGALEWAVGRAAIAVDEPPLAWADVALLPAERLIDSTLVLQPGLAYVRAAWRIDQLFTTFLRGDAPERFLLAEGDAYTEVRGARGAVQLAALDLGAFAFRSELAAGRSVGDAADLALECHAAFDPGAALRELQQSGLLIRITAPQSEDAR
jgi:hypothetical protein